MKSIIEVQNIWAEDLFKWFYRHILDSCGDGAGVIICDNYEDCADWFIRWWSENHKCHYQFLNPEYWKDRDFLHPKFEYDGIINYHDDNENFMFTNKMVEIFHHDYIFIVKEDCKFGYTCSLSANTIKKAKI